MMVRQRIHFVQIMFADNLLNCVRVVATKPQTEQLALRFAIKSFVSKSEHQNINSFCVASKQL